MRIKLINPNTSSAMTEAMARAAREVASPGTRIDAVTAASGPASIEGHYDEAISVIGLIDQMRADPDADAYVIACFGDPGLLAARELTEAPVLGIAEAAMHTATFLATSFSVVTTLDRTRIISEALVRNYGMQAACRRVRATDLPVLELEEPGDRVNEIVFAECLRALDQDRCGAIVLGCAGMAGLVDYLRARLPVPVIDGVTAAVKIAEALVGGGLRTSKHGDLAYPLPKAYSGSLAAYAPSVREGLGEQRPEIHAAR
ncbi:Asp/Glu racemase [Rhodobacter sp. SGA-6-6]|nr:Asp/Glu racemase [Rhodobacter sp. SGA-6-6]